MSIDFKKLTDMFPEKDIEWRVQSAGQSAQGKIWASVLPYVTNRAIMERLDNVAGPGGWRNEYVEAPGGGVLCGLSVKIETDIWITKWDGADKTSVEPTKGGLSNAMKRAAVQWGIGRYLYKLEMAWANIHGNGKHRQPKDRQGRYPAFNWDPPALPLWAVPQEDNDAPAPSLITSGQRQRLQILYKGLCDTREERLASLTKFCQRTITTMNEMTKDEASRLIKAIEERQQ